ncbi:sensor histidine kinase [Romboutsia weinsteinii]|uniref:histidine kinase n=1 Tax=Romboutsia weinsteinii TaxID=2020949 RepID=A0A371J9F1_9FIRM|nr:sensor histidine kinase [Romboutsia weinsteinii]
MDIKSKNNKYVIKLILVISILIAAIGVCLSYPKIEKDSSKFKYNMFESSSAFLDDIYNTNYALYYKMSKDDDNVLRPSDMILDLKGATSDQEIITRYQEKVDKKIYDWNDNLNNKLKNLDYYVRNKETKQSSKRQGFSQNPFLYDDVYRDNLSTLKEQYRFYMMVDYDENGNMTISRVHNGNKVTIYDKLQVIDKNKGNFDTYELENVEIKPIKNMTYVYAVAQNLQYNDAISNRVYDQTMYSYSDASMLFINIAMAFIVLVSLFVPYIEVKDIKIIDKLSKLPIEILVIIVSCAFAFIYSSSEIIMTSSIKGELINLTQISLSKEVVSALTYLLNIIYFTVCFSVISFGVFILKKIYKERIIHYFKNNSLIVKLISYCRRKIKKAWNNLTSFDLKDKNNSKLVKLLVINLIIIAIMCSFWFIGIIVAVIYSIILFTLIRKRYTMINNNYNGLLKLTNEIASGNLDVNTEEDLGVFNSLKEDVSQVQQGFKNAVKEEVKSQKMKTELISNVSHDLKTPLTSIITYVDLLKDENLTKEKREQYLDVLDRKSQRLKDLIEDLFEVSKATSGDVNLNMIDVDIVSLMKQTLLELDDKIIQSDLVIKKNIPSEKVILRLDSQRTFRVFENLILNITKYAMRGSRVFIDIIDLEDIVTISFKNMSEEEISYDIGDITERFVRGDKSRNTEGSGLGLAIAKSFVELQGGSFDVNIDGDLFKVIITFKKNLNGNLIR